MTGLTLRRSAAGVVLLVDGRPVTRPVSEAQALAAARELAGWRGASVWQDADGTEYVVPRIGGPVTTLEAQRGAAAVRLAYLAELPGQPPRDPDHRGAAEHHPTDQRRGDREP